MMNGIWNLVHSSIGRREVDPMSGKGNLGGNCVSLFRIEHSFCSSYTTNFYVV